MSGVGEIVGAVGVAHNPFFQLTVVQDGPGAAELRALYGGLAEHLRAMRPDAIVFFTTDHYNLFFEIVPIFSIGVAESAGGPCDFPQLPRYDVPIDGALAKEIQTHLVHADFDVGMVQELELDHTITAPLGLMVPEMDIPLVPVFLSTSMRPVPSARRCHALGAAVREAVERSALPRRVVAMASGAFSFEVGGPRMSDDMHVGVPAPGWVDHVVDLLAQGRIDRLVEETTPEQIEAAGNAAGEVLDWIAMLGTVDPAAPVHLEVQRDHGHAYAAWRDTVT
jgi:aromatic ring-opening dioxygenase catalytic subunit (LigB family)